MAAIKVLSPESRQGVKEFLTEIQMISDIDHENLVKLYGCCVEGTHRILVYNYLENNSLARTLLGTHLAIFCSRVHCMILGQMESNFILNLRQRDSKLTFFIFVSYGDFFAEDIITC